MAHEFCPTCKPSTKKKCATCPRSSVDPVELYRQQGQIQESRQLTYPANLPEEMEEHF